MMELNHNLLSMYILVHRYIYDYRFYSWIGLATNEEHNDCNTKNTPIARGCRRSGWKWEDDETTYHPDKGYLRWSDNQPGSYDHCAMMTHDGWFGKSCGYDGYLYICEKGGSLSGK